MAEVDTEILEKTEPVDGSVIYEQDFRVAAHSNGRTSHMVGGTVDGPPPINPEDDEPHHHGDSGGSSKSFQYAVAATYLVAGCVAFYVGITMIRELRGGKENKNGKN